MIYLLDKFHNSIDITVSSELQSLSNPILDTFFKIITQLGDIYAFMFLGLLLYIFIDKKHGYRYFLNMFLAGYIVSGLKILFQRLRPFDQNINIRSIGSKTHGFSFPSGHSQIATTISISYIHKFFTKFSIYLLFVFYIFIVGLSRIYLGQHFLTDVLTGISISIFIYFLLHNLLNLGIKDYTIGLILSIFYLSYTLFLAFYFNKFEKELVQISAGSLFFTLGYYLENKFIKYKEKQVFYIQILKLIISISLIGLIYFSKYILPYQKDVYNLNNSILDILRYGTIAFSVSFILPLVFKFLFKDKKPYYYKDKKLNLEKHNKKENYYKELINKEENNKKEEN